jgi:hypothetical protein
LHFKRPAGVEPALPPWQGSRLPLHHGRRLFGKFNCQRTRVGSAGVEPATSRLRAGCFAFQLQPRVAFTVCQLAAWGSNPAHRVNKTQQVDQTIAANCLRHLVASARVALAPPRLKVEHAPLTPRSRKWLTRSCFNRRNIFVLQFSGSPANRTQRHALIRRV